jgi:hypothetical protein
LRRDHGRSTTAPAPPLPRTGRLRRRDGWRSLARHDHATEHTESDHEQDSTALHIHHSGKG